MCKTVKEIKEFCKDVSTHDHKRSICRACSRLRIKKWNSTHKEYIRNYHLENYPESKERMIAWAKARALKIRNNPVLLKKFREHRRNMYRNNPIIREKVKAWQLSPKGRYSKYRAGAKTRGISFILTFEEFMTFWKKPCYYCGDFIQTIGLDRLDSHGAYSLENVIPSCRDCNLMKMDRGHGPFLERCARIASLHQPQTVLS